MKSVFHEAVEGQMQPSSKHSQGQRVFPLHIQVVFFGQERITGGWEGEELPSTRQKAMSSGCY